MESIRTSRQILKEWVEENMAPHTDWTGTRVETKNNYDSIDEMVDKLYEYLVDNHWRC
jgi:hypothetical protein